MRLIITSSCDLTVLMIEKNELKNKVPSAISKIVDNEQKT